ncbi:phospholipase D-like domain-containing protein [Neisseria dumasiana]|uniref:PLD phosphodiesterase domain-containing protein n=1 Tax=Neisseria dumasiana TaxID=1931275 RepID=A0A1X3DHG0_9NEIS|nr:phospholipase D-like domain-containing protein [Neisseria dumasiana]OSI19152.1 hypothetical protein BV912_08585 [Neisseria dumasiana]
MKIFTNQYPQSSYVANAFNDVEKGETLYFATAFFTELKCLEEVLENCGQLKLIVRLGFPTSAEQLKSLMNGKYKNKVAIRYYASSNFHPKLYIFGNRRLVVGSANFTNNALKSNQEVCIELMNNNETDSADIFNELKSTFESYWNEAKVLTKDSLEEYQKLTVQYQKIHEEIYRIDSKIPIHEFKNHINLKDKKKKDDLCFDELSKRYQIGKGLVGKIIDIYKESGRILDDEKLPLRLEVDAFISFVHDKYAKEISNCQLGLDNNQELIRSHISAFKQHYAEGTKYKDFLLNRCEKDLPRLEKFLSDKEIIQNAPIESIVQSIWVLNTIWTTIGRYAGGEQPFIKQFIDENGEQKIRDTLIYILYGKDSIEERIYQAVRGKYKLYKFDQSSVEELIGWINNENLPIINERVIRVLRYYGADVS